MPSATTTGAIKTPSAFEPFAKSSQPLNEIVIISNVVKTVFQQIVGGHDIPANGTEAMSCGQILIVSFFLAHRYLLRLERHIDPTLNDSVSFNGKLQY